MKRALLGAAVSAALLGVAAQLAQPWNLLILIALAPWLCTLRTMRESVVSALALAFAMTATCFYWLPATIAAYAHTSLAVGWLVAFALTPFVLQPQLLVAAAVRARFGSVAFVCAYVAAEWALPKLLGDSLGIALQPSRQLRQLAELGGVPLLTALCLTFSELVVARRFRTAAALLAVAFATGAVRAQEPPAKTFRAGLVQAAIASYDKLAAEEGTYEAVRKILDAHFALSQRISGAELLVWPETMYPTTFGAPKTPDAAELDREIAQFAGNTPLVFGAFEEDAQGEHNAAFFLERGAYDTYQKHWLFPLSEWVPRFLEPLRAPWMGHWQPGPGAKTVEVHLKSGTLKVAPLICYEALHAAYVDAEARDADLIVTLSNDAWFPPGAAPRLHLAAAALRSVETRLPQLRATNSGISALILPSGDVAAQTQFGEPAALAVDVPLAVRRFTPMKALGDWTGPVALLGLAAVCVRRTRRRLP